MASNKKPRKAYRQRGVILDTMNWVCGGFKPLVSIKDEDTKLRLKNHIALEAIAKGQATNADLGILIAASNMTVALKCGGFGDEHHDIARAGADAIEALRNRERYVCTGPELTAIKRLIELHDAQLDVVRINDLDAALKLARKKQAVAV
jgi:hypothetical protein